MSEHVIVADYHNPEFVRAVVGGLVYMKQIAEHPVEKISATVNDEGQLVVDDGEKRIIFEAMR